MIENNTDTFTGYDSPCTLCKRKNCTASVFFGKTCEFAIYKDYSNLEGVEYNYKPEPYVRRQHNKKKSYRRGKF